jgi:hypothetical protein
MLDFLRAFGWRWSSRASRPPPSSVRVSYPHPAPGAWQVTIQLQFLLQWDNEGIERQTVLDLFDAFGTKEKALHGNLRGHTGTHGSRASDRTTGNLRGPAPKASSATTPTTTPNRRRGVTGTSRSRQLAINRSMNGNRIGWR